MEALHRFNVQKRWRQVCLFFRFYSAHILIKQISSISKFYILQCLKRDLETYYIFCMTKYGLHLIGLVHFSNDVYFGQKT